MRVVLRSRPETIFFCESRKRFCWLVLLLLNKKHKNNWQFEMWIWARIYFENTFEAIWQKPFFKLCTITTEADSRSRPKKAPQHMVWGTVKFWYKNIRWCERRGSVILCYLCIVNVSGFPTKIKTILKNSMHVMR